MRHGRRWECPPSQGSPAPSLQSSRATDGGQGAGDRSPPQCSTSDEKSGGGAGAREVRSVTATGASSSVDAAGSVAGARAARATTAGTCGRSGERVASASPRARIERRSEVAFDRATKMEVQKNAE